MRLHGLGVIFFFFFFNDTATTEIYTLSLHDALPISNELHFHNLDLRTLRYFERCRPASGGFVEIQHILDFSAGRSEEHTSELQSQSNLVCRLLLEKKKKASIPSRTPLRTRRRCPAST